jgi:hypothetical protein
VSTKKRYGGFAEAVGMRVLTTPHGLGYAATVIVVDDDVDPFNLPQVMWALSTKMNPAGDLIRGPRNPMATNVICPRCAFDSIEQLYTSEVPGVRHPTAAREDRPACRPPPRPEENPQLVGCRLIPQLKSCFRVMVGRRTPGVSRMGSCR